MRIDWDQPITMDDGLVVRADIFRPITDGKYPVILTYGPYAKGLAFQDGYPSAWQRMVEKHPDVAAGSSNLYQSWEVVDPEKWVPAGYVCVRVDSRGAGCSPGFIDHFSPRETKDFYDCIEWAGVQPWSNGKVGLNGISYYGINAWHVASLQPPHLAAMCVWEGAADWYRDMTHHGGMLSTFWANWYDMQVKTVQYGAGERGKRSARARRTGVRAGDAERGAACEEPLRLRRGDPRASARRRLSQGALAASGTRSPRPCSPPRTGADRACIRAAISKDSCAPPRKTKWLEAHGIEHWTHFYTDYGRELQRKFFDYFLKGEDTGWGKQPRVLLQVRHPGEKFVERAENEWPIARTKWTKLYLNSADFSLAETSLTGEARVTFDALGEGVTFMTPPLHTETEITGPVAAKLFVSSSTTDADLFLILRVFSADMKEIVFQGAIDPHTPIAQGWLRASHRKLDPKSSPCPTGPITPTTRSSRSPPAFRSSSTSSCGRPRSWCRPAIAWRSRCAARITNTAAARAGGSRISRTS